MIDLRYSKEKIINALFKVVTFDALSSNAECLPTFEELDTIA
ncbi:hypothetical protein FLCU109888_10540 [Flavobacterium cucumis]|uniref:Uncharacterized protein n=1 Tax=Flavobacterium cucumis TaxID=416016 RepID=A0A1M7ZY41_9FLAO|nr:hypothetical protein SAMN05443547_2115 [Flavobacterium cucumis]